MSPQIEPSAGSFADNHWHEPGRAGTVTVEKLAQVGWFYRRFNPPRGYTFYLDQDSDV